MTKPRVALETAKGYTSDLQMSEDMLLSHHITTPAGPRYGCTGRTPTTLLHTPIPQRIPAGPCPASVLDSKVPTLCDQLQWDKFDSQSLRVWFPDFKRLEAFEDFRSFWRNIFDIKRFFQCFPGAVPNMQSLPTMWTWRLLTQLQTYKKKEETEETFGSVYSISPWKWKHQILWCQYMPITYRDLVASKTARC